MSSRALVLCVDEEPSIDGVGDLALERPDGFPLGLAVGHLLLEVDPALGVLLADLADGHHVDGVVQLAVAPATEAVEGPAPRGVLDGSYSEGTLPCDSGFLDPLELLDADRHPVALGGRGERDTRSLPQNTGSEAAVDGRALAGR